MADSRRCRRCKRKRLDDEPFEVQQYKTCAKCRIIERTKKKLRKPLAEETMRYGLKQFYEQNQNSNAHEDIFYSEQLKKELEAFERAAAAEGRTPSITLESANLGSTIPNRANGTTSTSNNNGGSTTNFRQSSSPGNHDMYQQRGGAGQQFSLYQGPNGGNSSNSIPTMNSYSGSIPTPSTFNHHNPNKIVKNGLPRHISTRPHPELHQYRSSSQSIQTSNQPRQYPTSEQQATIKRIKMNTPYICELCDDDLKPKDEINEVYRLCHECFKNPFAKENVYESFNEYMSHIAEFNGQEDLNDLNFICELNPRFIDHLDYQKPISSETIFREFLLDSLRNIYLNPLMGIINNVTFNQVKTNVNEYIPTSPTVNKYTKKNQYKSTNPIKANYKESNSDQDKNISSISMNYNIANNLLIIKLNHKFHFQKIDYSVDLLKKINSLILGNDKLNYTDSAIELYQYLKNDEQFGDFIKKVPLIQFKKDFPTFEKTLETIKSNEELVNADLNDIITTNSELQKNPTDSSDLPSKMEDGTSFRPMEESKEVDPVFDQ